MSCTYRLANIRRVVSALALTCIVGIGAAQTTKTYPVYKKLPVTQAVVQNTYDYSPQIRVFQGPPRDVEQNERETPAWPKGKANTIKLGANTKTPRIDLSAATKWPAIGATGWVPPDPTGAIGSDYVVVTVNSDIAFFKRDGTKLFQQSIGPDGFFSGVATVSFVFDPKCFYDPISKRFFVVALEEDDASTTSGILLGVSDSSDPRGTWKKYRIDAKITSGSTNYWMDYPGFGFNKDRVVICGNMFGFTDGWAGVQIISLDKASLIAGSTANSVTYLASDLGSAQWSKCYDSSVSTLYGSCVSSSTSIALLAITDTTKTTGKLVRTDIAVPAMTAPDWARSTSSHKLDTLDGRIMTMAYRSGHVVASHGVRNATVAHAVSRWYDIQTNGWPSGTSTPKLYQGGEVAGPTTDDYFMPAININPVGDIGMVFTRSSDNITADIMVVGRSATDALNTMGLPLKVATSDSVYGGSYNRWGDYFSVEVDPNDNKTFWVVGMVSRSGEWSTQVLNFKVNTNGIFGLPYDATALGIWQTQGAIVSGDYKSLWGADSNIASISSVPLSGTGQVAAPQITFNPGVTASTIARLGLSVNYSGPSGGSLLIAAKNVSTGKWDSVGTISGSTTSGFVAFPSTLKPANYIAADGTINIVARYIAPLRNNIMPPAFTLKVDSARLMIETLL